MIPLNSAILIALLNSIVPVITEVLLTLFVEVINIVVGEDKASFLLPVVLVPLLHFAAHHYYFLG